MLAPHIISIVVVKIKRIAPHTNFGGARCGSFASLASFRYFRKHSMYPISEAIHFISKSSEDKINSTNPCHHLLHNSTNPYHHLLHNSTYIPHISEYGAKAKTPRAAPPAQS